VSSARRRFSSLRAYREAHSLTQKEAAARVPIAQGAWNRIERGLAIPRPALAHRLVALTGVPIEELILGPYRHDPAPPPDDDEDERPVLRSKRVTPR
jgi:transcriptional regulator with XRE-family HTH domain